MATPAITWLNWFLAVLSWRVLLIWILINLFYSWQVLLLLQFWQFGDLYCLIVELKRTDYGINSIFDMCRYCRSSWLNMDTCRYEAWSQCWDETKLGEIGDSPPISQWLTAYMPSGNRYYIDVNAIVNVIGIKLKMEVSNYVGSYHSTNHCGRFWNSSFVVFPLWRQEGGV